MDLTPYLANWKTTLFGILSILSAVVNAVIMMVDSDVTTNPDWNVVVTAILIGIGVISSRQQNVTSARSRAK